MTVGKQPLTSVRRIGVENKPPLSLTHNAMFALVDGSGIPCLGRGRRFGARQKERETMKKFAKTVKHFLVSEDGPTSVEYAVLLALIVIVCLAAIQEIGHQAMHTFEDAADVLN